MKLETILKEFSTYHLEPEKFLDSHVTFCLHDDTDGTKVGNLVISFPDDCQCKIWTDSRFLGMNSGLRFRNHFGGGRNLRTHYALTLITMILNENLTSKKWHKNRKRRDTFLTPEKLKKFFNLTSYVPGVFDRRTTYEGLVIFKANDGDMHVWFENWGTGFNQWDHPLLFNAFIFLALAMQEDGKKRLN